MRMFWKKRKSDVKKKLLMKGISASYICLMGLIIMTINVYAVDDIFTVANTIIVKVYNSIAGISTVLAGLMTSVAVIGAKLSNNQQKTDQSWDWLKRIWIAWAIINSVGAGIAYIAPMFAGLNTIEVTTT